MILKSVKNAPLGVRLSTIVLGVFTLVGLLAPILANDQPLYLRVEGKSYYPAISGNSTIKLFNGKQLIADYPTLLNQNIPVESIIWPIVPFSPNRASIKGGTYPKPGTVVEGRKHVLGANGVGEDVLAGIIHGARISLQVGLLSMFISLLIGLIVGLLSGYWGNHHLRVSWVRTIAMFFGMPIAWFYSFSVRKYVLLDALETNSGMFFVQLLISLAIFISVLFIGLASIEVCSSQKNIAGAFRSLDEPFHRTLYSHSHFRNHTFSFRDA